MRDDVAFGRRMSRLIGLPLSVELHFKKGLLQGRVPGQSGQFITARTGKQLQQKILIGLRGGPQRYGELVSRSCVAVGPQVRHQ